MSLQQKNSILLQKVKDLVETSNKYNLTPSIRKDGNFGEWTECVEIENIKT